MFKNRFLASLFQEQNKQTGRDGPPTAWEQWASSGRNWPVRSQSACSAERGPETARKRQDPEASKPKGQHCLAFMGWLIAVAHDMCLVME
jgi:hypothetical protein